ncbi:hypothetical protein ACFVMC_26840 [Nocardia sp. NPDC127579]|uniref:hypothetical protein n=1 Tax=Nocardia sp. NPDC127579 TaxID=3345402 RepID=UPI00364218FD
MTPRSGTGTQAIQVRQIQLVEIGQPESARRSFRRDGQRDRVADRQADDANRFPGQPGLLARGELVAVGSGAHLHELRFIQ